MVRLRCRRFPRLVLAVIVLMPLGCKKDPPPMDPDVAQKRLQELQEQRKKEKDNWAPHPDLQEP